MAELASIIKMLIMDIIKTQTAETYIGAMTLMPSYSINRAAKRSPKILPKLVHAAKYPIIITLFGLLYQLFIIAIKPGQAGAYEIPFRIIKRSINHLLCYSTGNRAASINYMTPVENVPHNIKSFGPILSPIYPRLL